MAETYKNDLVEVFEDVKEAVRTTEGLSRAGLMLGLQELGSSPHGFVGGYYMTYSNLIVLNKTSLTRIMETNPQLLKPYAFHVLLHEYIHSLGFFDEETARRLTYEVSMRTFGENHTVTEMARDIRKYFPNLVHPSIDFRPAGAPPIEAVEGFDKSSYRQYIT